MTRRKLQTEDPVVAEVRAARLKLVQKGGGTLEGFFRVAREEAARTRSGAARPKPKRESRRRRAS